MPISVINHIGAISAKRLFENALKHLCACAHLPTGRFEPHGELDLVELHR
jgi:hypothetical protein